MKINERKTKWSALSFLNDPTVLRFTPGESEHIWGITVIDSELLVIRSGSTIQTTSL